MTNFPNSYSDTDYIALGYYLRREMFGVELNEDENILATMSILKFGEIRIPEFVNEIQRIEVDGKWGLISKEGWVAFYDYIDSFEKGFAKVKQDNKQGHINTKGELLADKWYDYVWSFQEGFAEVVRGGKHGHINTKGELLADNWYDFVWHFQEGFAVVRQGRKWSFIDKKGKIVIPYLTYDRVNNFSGGYAMVSSGNKCGFINRGGKLVFGGLIYDAPNKNNNYTYTYCSYTRQYSVNLNGENGKISKSNGKWTWTKY